MADARPERVCCVLVFLSVPIRVTTRPAFCGTVPKLGALSRVPQDVSCVPHFKYVFCIIFFSSQKLKYQNKKYIKTVTGI